ncbi:hypothetical protein PR048_000858 [Dryococelus australis]|uniref:Uncharacterized protein n=1 Tax=Dryococelus australis TaxID=614101 RepID=A0ABQ9IGD4_9NEOP|nr:hypothetical protein PR048_000858 [Dryococelus australis]
MVCTEPVGGSAPKFPTGDKSRTVETKQANSFTLFCPAQGKLFQNGGFATLWVCTEPVGSAKPKFSKYEDKIRGFEVFRKMGTTFVMQCPAQGFPVPLFSSQLWINYEALKHCVTQASQFNAQHKVFLSQHLEPVGSAKPKFSSVSKIRGFDAQHNIGAMFILQCPAQGFPVPVFSVQSKGFLSQLLEPVGSTSPKISVVAKSQGLEAKSNHSFVVMCPAQAFPVPAFSLWLMSERNYFPTFCMIVFEWIILESKRLLVVNRSYYRWAHIVEPVGSSAPKFSTVDNLQGLKARFSHSFALPCPAQGFPVPVFR